MTEDDNDGQMIFGDLGGLKIPYICFTVEGKPRKNLNQETDPTGDGTRTRSVRSNDVTPRPPHWSHIIAIVPINKSLVYDYDSRDPFKYKLYMHYLD